MQKDIEKPSAVIIQFPGRKGTPNGLTGKRNTHVADPFETRCAAADGGSWYHADAIREPTRPA